MTLENCTASLYITLTLQTVKAATTKTSATAGAMEMAVISRRITGRTGTAYGKGSGGQRSLSTGMYCMCWLCIGEKDVFFSVGYNCMRFKYDFVSCCSKVWMS